MFLIKVLSRKAFWLEALCQTGPKVNLLKDGDFMYFYDFFFFMNKVVIPGRFRFFNLFFHNCIVVLVRPMICDFALS